MTPNKAPASGSTGRSSLRTPRPNRARTVAYGSSSKKSTRKGGYGYSTRQASAGRTTMRLFLIAIAAPHGAGDERLRYRVGATRLSGSAEPRHHAAQTLGLVRYLLAASLRAIPGQGYLALGEI